MSATILLAEDDASLRFVLSQALSKEGFLVRATSNVATLSKWAREGEGDIVLSDVYLGEECLFDALPAMRAARPALPVIVMSAQSTVATALSASGAGAYDYVPKPFDLDDLIVALRSALMSGPDAKSRAQAHRAEKEERLPLIGRSPAMQEVYRVMARVAATDLTVLIEGESGAGKERVARALHEHSRRADKPFVAASLAGASVAYLESEVFGPHGTFALARGGAVFLEDLDALPSEAQARLVGLLQSEVASETPTTRLLVATQRNLATLVADGGFRQDLFYRLNVVLIRLPPLRERLGDVGDLARTFLVRARREGLPAKTLDQAAIERLKAHDFPGNVRELENLLRRAAALTPAAVITARDIAAELAANQPQNSAAAPVDAFRLALTRRLKSEFSPASGASPAPGLHERLLAEVEGPMISEALAAARGSQIRAAAVLGINRNTLRKKIQALNIPTGRVD